VRSDVRDKSLNACGNCRRGDWGGFQPVPAGDGTPHSSKGRKASSGWSRWRSGCTDVKRGPGSTNRGACRSGWRRSAWIGCFRVVVARSRYLRQHAHSPDRIVPVRATRTSPVAEAVAGKLGGKVVLAPRHLPQKARGGRFSDRIDQFPDFDPPALALHIQRFQLNRSSEQSGRGRRPSTRSSMDLLSHFDEANIRDIPQHHVEVRNAWDGASCGTLQEGGDFPTSGRRTPDRARAQRQAARREAAPFSIVSTDATSPALARAQPSSISVPSRPAQQSGRSPAEVLYAAGPGRSALGHGDVTTSARRYVLRDPPTACSRTPSRWTDGWSRPTWTPAACLRVCGP